MEAAIKVDIKKLLACTFPEAVELYRELIFNVLDEASDQLLPERSQTAGGYDFERLKRDLREEAGVVE